MQIVTDYLDVWSSVTVKKATTGRGRNGKISPYGIQKLRGLILELAMRGKLVSQDPNNEPASVLLKKITEEKERLVKEGRIRKQKVLPEIGDIEKPFELPGGWAWGQLGNICIFENGDRSKNYPNKSLLVETGIPFINAGHLQDGQINLQDMSYITKDRFDMLRSGKVEEGDILYCLRGSLGKTAIVSNIKMGAIASSLVIIRPFSDISNKYLLDYFDSPLSTGIMRRYDNGTAQPNLSATDLGKFSVPIPPFEEQHHIVAKVDELLTLCDKLEQQQTDSITAHQILVETLLGALTTTSDQKDFEQTWQRIAEHFDTLFTTEQSIDQLKQTILQLAVMGKLVPQNPNDEPTSVLLKKISEEKVRLVKDGKIRNKKPLFEISGQEKRYDLVDAWAWTRFGNIVDSRLGKMLDRRNNKGSPKPYLRNTNVQWDRFDLSDIKDIRLEDSELSEYRILPGDLLICEGGEPGRCAIWSDQNTEIYFQKALHRARPYLGILARYLLICLMVDAGTGILNQYFTGATIKHFPGDKLSRYVVALPPTSEQQRIVAKVDELMALCDALKARLQDAQNTQTQLADAIVEQAVA